MRKITIFPAPLLYTYVDTYIHFYIHSSKHTLPSYICSLNPLESISSASSSTNNFTSSSFKARRLIMSYTRPGVPERGEAYAYLRLGSRTSGMFAWRTDYDVYAVHENIDVLPYGSATHTGVHMYLQEVAQGLDHLHIHYVHASRWK